MGATLAAFLASLILLPLFQWLGRALGMMDQPDGGRKLHRKATPRTGGLAIAAATLAAAAYSGAWKDVDWRLGTAVTVILASGVWDDRHGLGPRGKFLGQIVSGLLLCWAGYSTHWFGGMFWWLDWLATVFLVCLVTNAWNLIDGSDGLAAVLALLALTPGIGNVWVSSLCGAVAAFLLFNWAPAKIFLGDTGSLLLGFAVTVVTLRHGLGGPFTESWTAWLPAAIPVADTGLAFLRRMLRGRPVFCGDHMHIHHRLGEMGMTAGMVAMVLGVWTGIAVWIASPWTPLPLQARTAASAAYLTGLLILLGRLDYAEFAGLVSFLRKAAWRPALARQIALADCRDPRLNPEERLEMLARAAGWEEVGIRAGNRLLRWTKSPAGTRGAYEVQMRVATANGVEMVVVSGKAVHAPTREEIIEVLECVAAREANASGIKVLPILIEERTG